MPTKRPKVSKKLGKQTQTVQTKTVKSSQTKFSLFNKLTLSESYVSLGLGILVVLILALLLLLFARGRHLKGPGILSGLSMEASLSAKQVDSVKSTPKEANYVVEEGDDLSSISLKVYGTEDKWEAIANANTIENPDSVEVGQILKIPR